MVFETDRFTLVFRVEYFLQLAVVNSKQHTCQA